MKKRLAVVMAVILTCGCLFAACSKTPNKPVGNNGEVTTDEERVIPVYVSETEYLYATNPDGSYETVVQTDVEGNTHVYLKGIRPGAASTDADSEEPAQEDTQLYEQENSSVVSRFIEILNSGRFEMDGYISTDGERMPLTFRTYGDNVRMGTEVEGISLDFAIIDGVTYLLSEKNKSYIELTESIKRQLDLDSSSLSFDGFGEINDDQTVKTEATYNGKTVDCYSAQNSEGEVKFYVDGENVVKIEVFDTQGHCTTMIETTLVRGDLTPDDLAIPSDFKKESYIQFIAGIMSDML